MHPVAILLCEEALAWGRVGQTVADLAPPASRCHRPPFRRSIPGRRLPPLAQSKRMPRRLSEVAGTKIRQINVSDRASDGKFVGIHQGLTLALTAAC